MTPGTFSNLQYSLFTIPYSIIPYSPTPIHRDNDTIDDNESRCGMITRSRLTLVMLCFARASELLEITGRQMRSRGAFPLTPMTMRRSWSD